MRDKTKKSLTILTFIYYFLYAIGFFETIGVFLNPYRYRGIGLGLVFILALVMRLPSKNKLAGGVYENFFALATMASMGYMVFCYHLFGLRIGSAEGIELLLGVLAIFVVLEITRITSGVGITIVACILMLYSFVGEYMPGFFQTPKTSFSLFIGQTYLGMEGIFGLPTGIILDYIFPFLIFGAVFNAAGGLRFFQGVALIIFRGARGASAKIAIAINALFGMISGSTLAGVLVTGPLTIPEMRKEGFSERFMGALIAAAADAAQLMPPVMGVVAFAMAELLHMSYFKICMAAYFPALLYYFSLYLTVHLEGRKRNLNVPSLTKDQTQTFWELITTYWPCIVSGIFLIILLGSQKTTTRLAIMYSTGLLFAGTFLSRKTRPSLKGFTQIIEESVKGLVTVAPVCATAGIIIACFSLTTLDYKFSATLTNIAGQSLFLILILASVASLVLGMGMPTLPAYILVALLIAPTLESIGVPPLVTHMFVFYMSMAAMLTPPVCLNVYVVAPMVNSTIWKIGITSSVMAAARYVIPFFFVYHRGLLLMGSLKSILVDLGLAFLITLAISFGQIGYGLVRAKGWERIIAIFGGILIFFKFGEFEIHSQIIGSGMLIIMIVSQLCRFLRRSKIAGIENLCD